MLRLIKTPAAQGDIQDIAEWIAGDSLEAALRVVDEIDSVLRLLQRHPHLGESIEHLGPGLRRITAGSYVLYYRVNPEAIVLIRVMHGARDADATLE